MAFLLDFLSALFFGPPDDDQNQPYNIDSDSQSSESAGDHSSSSSVEGQHDQGSSSNGSNGSGNGVGHPIGVPGEILSSPPSGGNTPPICVSPGPFFEDLEEELVDLPGSRGHSWVSLSLFPHLNDSNLPRLPVPSLRGTLKRYLSTLRPLLRVSSSTDSDSEFSQLFRRCSGRIHRFLASEEAKSLQKDVEKLEQESADFSSSYTEGLWLERCLGMRVPPPQRNPAFGMANDGLGRNTAERAASIVVAALRIWGKIKNRSSAGGGPASGSGLTRDLERGVPLCMAQYGNLFGTTRLPGHRRDFFCRNSSHRRRDHREEECEHFVVICNGRFFSVPLLGSRSRRRQQQRLLTDEEEEEEEGEQQLIVEEFPFREGHYVDIFERILDFSREYGDEELPVGLLTTLPRTKWSKIRGQLLLASVLNRNSLAEIRTALFLVCLEPEIVNVQRDNTTFLRCLLHGNGSSRFFDKSTQFVVAGNRVGMNVDNASYDGHTAIMLFHRIFGREIRREIPKRIESEFVPSAALLRWDLLQDIREKIVRARVEYSGFVDCLDVFGLQFPQFGKNLIKQLHMSPDAFLQLAFQLSFARLHEGRLGSVYETANVKRFYHGRTEGIRTVTDESVELVSVFFSDPEKVSDEDKVDALRAAVKRHVDGVRLTKQGRGIDRHLFILKRLAEQKRDRVGPHCSIPSFFGDYGFQMFSTNVITSSNCSGSPGVDWFVLPPACPYGFGLGYVIQESRMNVAVTNYQGRSREFADVLTEVLIEMRRICNATTTD